jgi:hypothetical protein
LSHGRWRLAAARWGNTHAVLADALKSAMIVMGGVAFAVAIGFLFRQNAPRAVAATGIVLQWLGLGVVALGFMSLRRRFGHPTWFQRLWRALQQPPDTTMTVGAAGISVGGATVAGVGGVSHANATIEQRLHAIEASVQRLHEDVNDVRHTLTTRVEAVTSRVDRECAERAAGDRDMLRQLEDVSAGGLRLERIGWWWLLLGVPLTSLPSDIAAFLQWVLGR